IWTNRPLGFWPQGVPRPEPLKEPADQLRWNGQGVNLRLAAAMAGNYPVPETLRWDLFLGAAAPNFEYHPVYHPFNWRGWVDWGCGAIGDMGAHLMDHAMWALDLGYPTTIETVATPFNRVCFPHATMTIYEFPARNGKPAVKLTWYDAKLTEVMLLGVVALKAGRKIEYDGAHMRITNVPAANQYLDREPRPGWSF